MHSVHVQPTDPFEETFREFFSGRDIQTLLKALAKLPSGCCTKNNFTVSIYVYTSTEYMSLGNRGVGLIDNYNGPESLQQLLTLSTFVNPSSFLREQQ